MRFDFFIAIDYEKIQDSVNDTPEVPSYVFTNLDESTVIYLFHCVQCMNYL